MTEPRESYTTKEETCTCLEVIGDNPPCPVHGEPENWMPAAPAKIMVRTVITIAAQIDLDDSSRLVDEVVRTETLMPIFDPTGWLKIGDTARGWDRLYRAFHTFRKEIESVLEKERRRS